MLLHSAARSNKGRMRRAPHAIRHADYTRNRADDFDHRHGRRRAARAPPELKPKNPDSAKPNTQQAAPILPGQTVYTAPTATDAAGGDKSALFRIFPDNTVETLWSSKEENIYDVLLSGTQILFSTDANGRIYRMAPDHRVTLIAQTNEGETTRLLLSGDSVLAATGTMGKLYRLSESVTADGFYESPVHDAGSVARWGQLDWRGERKGTAKLAFRTRSGNSARPGSHLERLVGSFDGSSRSPMS